MAAKKFTFNAAGISSIELRQTSKTITSLLKLFQEGQAIDPIAVETAHQQLVEFFGAHQIPVEVFRLKDPQYLKELQEPLEAALLEALEAEASQTETEESANTIYVADLAEAAKVTAPTESSLQKVLKNYRQDTTRLTKFWQEQERIKSLEKELYAVTKDKLSQHTRTVISPPDTAKTDQAIHEAITRSIEHADSLDDITHRLYKEIENTSTISTQVSDTLDEEGFQGAFDPLKQNKTLIEVIDYQKTRVNSNNTRTSAAHQDLDELLNPTTEAALPLREIVKQKLTRERVDENVADQLLTQIEDHLFLETATATQTETGPQTAVARIFGNRHLAPPADTELVLVEYAHIYQSWLNTHPNLPPITEKLIGFTPYDIEARLERYQTLNPGAPLDLTSLRLSITSLPAYDFSKYTPTSPPPAEVQPQWQQWLFVSEVFEYISNPVEGRLPNQPAPVSSYFPQPPLLTPAGFSPASVMNRAGEVSQKIHTAQNLSKFLGGSASPGTPSIVGGSKLARLGTKIIGGGKKFVNALQLGAKAAKLASTISGIAAALPTLGAGAVATIVVAVVVVLGVSLYFAFFGFNGAKIASTFQADSISGKGGGNGGIGGGFCDPQTNSQCVPTFCSDNCLCPVHGSITQGPGGSWSHTDDYGNPVNAIDIGIAMDTPVFSMSSGVVSYADFSPYGYGNLVVVDNPDGTQLYYGHLDTYFVQVGQSVAVNEQIGLSDDTGNSTGPHLHVEYRGSGVQNILNLFNFTDAEKAILNGCSDNCGGLSCSN